MNRAPASFVNVVTPPSFITLRLSTDAPPPIVPRIIYIYIYTNERYDQRILQAAFHPNCPPSLSNDIYNPLFLSWLRYRYRRKISSCEKVGEQLSSTNDFHRVVVTMLQKEGPRSGCLTALTRKRNDDGSSGGRGIIIVRRNTSMRIFHERGGGRNRLRPVDHIYLCVS